MRKYKYKNIVCYCTQCRWYADYVDDNGKRFALHRASTRTKEQAMALAKHEVDYLNETAYMQTFRKVVIL